MPRVPRSLIVFNNHSVHKVWRGHNKEYNIKTDYEKGKYLEFLNDDIDNPDTEVGAELQAITIMSNHTHEVYLIKSQPDFSNHMRRHHGRYGMFFNKLKGRCGKVAQGRAKTCLLQQENYEMKTVFYIHANPIRAHMVKDAKDYKWSTHNLYAFGKRQDWMKNIKLPAWYHRLGKTLQARQKKYRKLFANYLKTKGRVKQPFLKKYFYGDVTWMDEKSDDVSKWRASQAPP